MHQAIVACRACETGGYLPRANPISYGGRVTDRVMIIGQAPGPVTDQRRQHFSGPAGRLLERWLTAAGFEAGAFRQRCYLTALTRCFPGKDGKGKGDRRPSARELHWCRPFLEQELALVEPRVVLLVGQMAITTFLGRHRLEDVVGKVFERDERYFVPLPHSSGVSRWLNDPAHRALVDEAIAQLSVLRLQLGLS